MIFGVGLDLIEVERVRRELERDPEFREQVFTPEEIAYCDRHRHSAQHYAARFAAKEAFLKALGTGWRQGITFTDVEVRHDALGKPELHLSGRAADLAAARFIGRLHLSITHLRETAGAVVVLETGESGESAV